MGPETWDFVPAHSVALGFVLVGRLLSFICHDHGAKKATTTQANVDNGQR